MKVVHKSNVVQLADYYPFGMQHNSGFDRANIEAVRNDFLYNSATELNRTSGLYETPLRLLNPAIGRFYGVDVLAGAYSSMAPYQYGANDPFMYNDPTGALLGDMYGNQVDKRMLYHTDGGPGAGGYGSYSGRTNNPGKSFGDRQIENALQEAGFIKIGGKIGYYSDELSVSYDVDDSYWEEIGEMDEDYASFLKNLAPMTFSSDFVTLLDFNDPHSMQNRSGVKGMDQTSGGSSYGGPSDATVYGWGFTGLVAGGKGVKKVLSDEIVRQRYINMKAAGVQGPVQPGIKVPKSLKLVGKFGGVVFTALGAVDIEQQYQSGEINSYWRNAEQIANGAGAIPVIGTGVSVGWELGRLITQRQWYQKLFMGSTSLQQ